MTSAIKNRRGQARAPMSRGIGLPVPGWLLLALGLLWLVYLVLV